MEAKTLIPIILGVTLLVAGTYVAKGKWNVPPEQGLESRDLTQMTEIEEKTKYVLNQEEQEKTKKEEHFPLSYKQRRPRNTETLFARRKKYSVIDRHLNKQLIHAKRGAERLEENVARRYSHKIEIIAQSEIEGSGVMESTTQMPTQMYTPPEGSGEVPSTPKEITEIFTTPVGPEGTTTEKFTTQEGSGEQETTSNTDASTITTAICQNGGAHDGLKCICPGDFFGELCETPLGDRVLIGNTVSATVTVEMKITNRAYRPEFQNPLSTVYIEFEIEFKKEMYIYYSVIKEYVDVEIKQLRPGSVSARKRGAFARIADVSPRSDSMDVVHDVIFKLPLEKDQNVTTTEYEKVLDTIKDRLELLKDKQCTNENSGFCIDGESLNITEVKPKTAEDLCMESLPEGVREFYSPYFSTDGVTCVSDCDLSSGKYKSCNNGSCRIRYQTGRACFCPDTDIYLYMYSDCEGTILKAGLYGGVGAAIAVLFIALITVTYFLLRRGKNKKLDPFANDQEDSWCEENDSEWHVDRGITNLSDHTDETDGDSSKNNQSREKFKPVLDNINTTLEIKIQRPEVTRLKSGL